MRHPTMCDLRLSESTALMSAVALMGEAIVARHVAARSGQQAEVTANAAVIALTSLAATAVVLGSDGLLSRVAATAEERPS